MLFLTYQPAGVSAGQSRCWKWMDSGPRHNDNADQINRCKVDLMSHLPQQSPTELTFLATCVCRSPSWTPPPSSPTSESAPTTWRASSPWHFPTVCPRSTPRTPTPWPWDVTAGCVWPAPLSASPQCSTHTHTQRQPAKADTGRFWCSVLWTRRADLLCLTTSLDRDRVVRAQSSKAESRRCPCACWLTGKTHWGDTLRNVSKLCVKWRVFLQL